MTVLEITARQGGWTVRLGTGMACFSPCSTSARRGPSTSSVCRCNHDTQGTKRATSVNVPRLRRASTGAPSSLTTGRLTWSPGGEGPPLRLRPAIIIIVVIILILLLLIIIIIIIIMMISRSLVPRQKVCRAAAQSRAQQRRTAPRRTLLHRAAPCCTVLH